MIHNYMRWTGLIDWGNIFSKKIGTAFKLADYKKECKQCGGNFSNRGKICEKCFEKNGKVLTKKEK